jgi:mannose-6-phosphate isomerase-like protein (cupin superfamily)
MLLGGAAAARRAGAAAAAHSAHRRVYVRNGGRASRSISRRSQMSCSSPNPPCRLPPRSASLGTGRRPRPTGCSASSGLCWATVTETGGAFSVMEQWMRQGSGPPIPHIHPIDEWFYVMEGEMTVELGNQTIIGRAGDSLWIPRGTVHRFKVTSPLITYQSRWCA